MFVADPSGFNSTFIGMIKDLKESGTTTILLKKKAGDNKGEGKEEYQEKAPITPFDAARKTSKDIKSRESAIIQVYTIKLPPELKTRNETSL